MLCPVAQHSIGILVDTLETKERNPSVPELRSFLLIFSFKTECPLLILTLMSDTEVFWQYFEGGVGFHW